MFDVSERFICYSLNLSALSTDPGALSNLSNDRVYVGSIGRWVWAQLANQEATTPIQYSRSCSGLKSTSISHGSSSPSHGSGARS